MSEKYRRLCEADGKVIRNMNQDGSSQREIGQGAVENRGAKGYSNVDWLNPEASPPCWMKWGE